MPVDLALVQKAGPLRVGGDDEASAAPAAASTNTIAAVDGLRHELTAIYESYATLYPNPRLTEERKERNALLRAVSAASEATQLNPASKQKQGGWWSSLFGGASSDKAADTAKEDEFGENHDDRLIYHDIVDPNSDTQLCGTTASLDPTCIPPEADAVARFHIASTRSHSPNVARTAWERPGTALVVVVGLGVLAEYRDDTDDEAVLRYSSDRAVLLQRAQKQSNASFDTSHARAALIGPNLLIVSWGGVGGSDDVFFYRRLSPSEDETPTVGWHAVARVSPTPKVLDRLGDVFAQDDVHESSSSSSPLLRVTDVVPIVVEQGEQIPAASVAIARLGGCMELVPLPHGMWFGPEQDRRSVQRGSNKRQPHQLPNLVQISTIPVVDTSEYHTDILTLDVFRTSVRHDSPWNDKLYPDSPPAEHVLAAAGRLGSDETLTFWSVSTVYTSQRQQNQQQQQDPIGFSLVVTLSEALGIGPAGPPVSLFCSPTILRHWRKPRRVELKPDYTTTTPNTSSTSPEETRITTISVPAPVVSICFLCQGNGVRAAALDWNGGIRVLDCDWLERAVSQTLSSSEYNDLYRSSNSSVVLPLVTKMSSRGSIAQQLAASNKQKQNLPVEIEWSGISNGEQPLLVVVTSSSSTRSASRTSSSSLLHLVDTSRAQEPPISVPLPNGRATILHRFGLRGTLSLVSTRTRRRTAKSSTSRTAAAPSAVGMEVFFGALHQQDARDIVASLARDPAKLSQAVAASQALGPEDQHALQSIVESCKQRLWESQHDLASLEQVVDHRYVVDQALQFAALRNEEDDDEELFLLFRRVHYLALERLSKAPTRLGATIALAGLEGTEAVADQIRERLVKAGTYELLCRQHFCETEEQQQPSFELFQTEMLPLSSCDLAKSLARACDMAALSLVCCRHRRQCLEGQEALDELPLVLETDDYQHLLPVVSAGNDSFFLDNNLNLAPTSELPALVQSRFGLECVLDGADAKLVLEHSQNPSNVVVEEEVDASLGVWYLARVNRLEDFLSSPRRLVDFTQVGLAALGGNENLLEPSPALSDAVEQLGLLHSRYQVLLELLLEQSSAELTISSDKLGLDELAALDLVDLLGITVGDGGTRVDAVELDSRYKRFLLPLLEERMWETSLAEEVAGAICLHCEQAVSESTDAPTMCHASSLCAAFVSLSRTALPKDARIIADKEMTMSFVVSVVGSIIEGCTNKDLSADNCRTVVNDLWAMYEALPHSSASKNGTADFSDYFTDLSHQVDSFFEELVVLDVAHRWLGDEAFSLVYDRRSAKDGEVPEIDQKVVKSLCLAFRKQCERGGPSGNTQSERLAQHLLDDIADMNRLAFKDSFSVKDTLLTELLSPLLKLRKIPLMGACLSRMKPDWIDSDQLSAEVSDFVTNAVFSDKGDVSPVAIQAAIGCQDVLGKYLSSLDSLFKESRQYLDSAEFINSVFLAGAKEGFVTPATIRSDSPMNTIDHLLSRDPLLAIHDKQEWRHAEWAQGANGSIREYYQKKKSVAIHDPFAPEVEPAQPPGTAILHLAQLLGITKADELAVVRTLLTRCCTQGGLFGAAGAISRAFLIESSPADNKVLILPAVAELVAEKSYVDIETKRELCLLVFENIKGELNSVSIQHYQAVMAEFSEIESALLARDQPIKHPIVSFRRLCQDTTSEYSVDVASLFATLRGQIASNSVDDELLNTLAHYTYFWCISQCTRPKYGDPIPFDKSSMETNFSLASSLVLHIADIGLRRESSTQIKTTFDEQKNAALGRHRGSLAAEWVEPDKEVVRRLVGRGYSELAARRAVVLSGNNGFETALQWAVMHTLDGDIDAPLVVTRPRDDLHLNKDGMEYVSGALQKFIALLENGDESAFFSANAVVASGALAETISKPVQSPGASGQKKVQSPIFGRKTQPYPSKFGNGVPDIDNEMPTPIMTNASRSLEMSASSSPDPPFVPALSKLKEETTKQLEEKLPCVAESGDEPDESEKASTLKTFAGNGGKSIPERKVARTATPAMSSLQVKPAKLSMLGAKTNPERKVTRTATPAMSSLQVKPVKSSMAGAKTNPERKVTRTATPAMVSQQVKPAKLSMLGAKANPERKVTRTATPAMSSLQAKPAKLSMLGAASKTPTTAASSTTTTTTLGAAKVNPEPKVTRTAPALSTMLETEMIPEQKLAPAAVPAAKPSPPMVPAKPAPPPVRPTTRSTAPAAPREIPPPPPRPKLDMSKLRVPERSALRERGEVVLKKARNHSGSPSREERRRLIEEGRRLLQEARAANTSGSGNSASSKKAAVPLSSPMRGSPPRSRVGRSSPSASPQSPLKRKVSIVPSRVPPPPPPPPAEAAATEPTKPLPAGDDGPGAAAEEGGAGWDFDDDLGI